MAFYNPKTLDEALALLEKEGAKLKPVAGSTDISVGIQEKVLKVDSFINLGFLEELKGIEEKDGKVIVGACASHNDVASSETVLKKGGVLAQACQTVGSPQIRNRGTVGGNSGHASPSGDSIPGMMALDAEVVLESKAGKRKVPAVEFFTGPGRNVRKDDELITAFEFKGLGDNYVNLYQKLGQRKSLSCSKASMAFVAKVEGKKISDVRIAMGAVAPTVVRGGKTEKFLEGKTLDEKLIKEAAEMVMSEVTPIDDLRSTAEYRKQMMGALLEKALKKAMK